MPALFDQPDCPTWVDSQFSFSGGQVNDRDPALLEPNQAARLLNIQPLEVGGVRRRLGFAPPTHIPFPHLGARPILNGVDPKRGVYNCQGILSNRDLLLFQATNRVELSHLTHSNWGGAVNNTYLNDFTLLSTTPGYGANGFGATSTGTLAVYLASCTQGASAPTLPYAPLAAIVSPSGSPAVTLTHITNDYGGRTSSVVYPVELHNLRARSLCWWNNRLWAFNCPNYTEYTWGQMTLGPSTLCWSHPCDGRTANNYRNSFGKDAYDNVQRASLNPPLIAAHPFWNSESPELRGKLYTAGEGYHGISGHLDIGSSPGDVGVAIIPARGADADRLLLFKETSIWALDVFWGTGPTGSAADGNYPTTANSLDYTISSLRPLTQQTGMVGTLAGCWVYTEDTADFLFLSREGIRSLNKSKTDEGGDASLPLSSPIQSTIDRINWPSADVSIAHFWNSVAYFAIPVDGSTTNNLLLVYDTINKSWSEIDIPTQTLLSPRIAPYPGKRSFCLSPPWPASSYSLGSDLLRVPAVLELSSTTEFDQLYSYTEYRPINFCLETRAFTFSQPSVPKRWKSLELFLAPSNTGATLSLAYRLETDPTWTSLPSVYLPGDASLPYGTEGRVTHTYVGLSSIPPGKSLQLQVSDSTSFARYRFHGLALYASPAHPKYYPTA